MLVVSLICGLGAGGCVLGQPVEPLFATVGSSYFCGRVQFTITSATTVTPDWPDRPCSGNPPLAILDAGTMGWDEANGRTLTMPLRIVNRGTEPVQLPIRLILAVNGKTVLNPFETPNSTMVPLNADSTRTDGTKVWLVGGSGTVGPGDSTAIKTVLFQINSPVIQGRFAFTISGEIADLVPATPPDTVPSWFSDDSSYTNGGRGFLRGVIGISFKVGTTHSQKIAAISVVGGTVIGGRAGDPGWDGGYYLRILDDGTGTQLTAAVNALIARPEILTASLIHPMRPFWRRPTDGNNWKPANWNLEADSAIGENWALEAIRAPLAWGCETGSTLPRIWVADRGFDSLPDLAPNILQPPLGGFFRAPGDTAGHGTRVASVIAAVGNNQVGMTGVMWTAGLKLRTVQRITDYLEVIRMLRGVVTAGADIVNISGGRGYDTTLTAQANSQIGQKFASDIAAGLGSHGSSPQMPLLVVAAGDENVDADVAGMPGLKVHLPGKVLVVAAAQTPSGGQQRPWTGVTNTGPLIDVYAPGLAVAQLDTLGNVEFGINNQGTSFSTAIVTGVAGLLKSFDPSLTPTQLRDRVVEGSQGTNRNGVVDAYASLQLAARRHGAPLCGNRVFVDAQNRIRVQRSGPSDLETIWQATPADSIRAIYPYHGGRRTGMYSDDGGDQILGFNQGAWSSAPWTPSPPTELTGAYYSRRMTIHDGDSLVSVGRTPVGSGTQLNLTLGNGPIHRTLANFLVPHLVQSGDSHPTRRSASYDTTGAFVGWAEGTPQDISNFESTLEGGGKADPSGFPSPMGDRVFVRVNLISYTFLGWGANEGWAAAPGSEVKDGHNTHEQRSVGFRAASKRAMIYAIPWAGGMAPLVREAQDSTIEWMGVSEDGSEVVVAIGRYDSVDYPNTYSACDIQYWNATGSYGVKDRFPTAIHVCNWFNEHAGGFSAVIAETDLANPFHRRGKAPGLRQPLRPTGSNPLR